MQRWILYEAVTRQHGYCSWKYQEKGKANRERDKPRTKVWKLKDSRERYNDLTAESDKESREVNIKWRETRKILEEAASTHVARQEVNLLRKMIHGGTDQV